MSQKLYNNIKLMVDPTSNDENIVNLGTVKQLMNKKIKKEVKCVVSSPITGVYDKDTQTLTQTEYKEIDSDDVELLAGDEILYIDASEDIDPVSGKSLMTRCGRYTVVTAPSLERDSKITSYVSAYTTFESTQFTVNKDEFEIYLGDSIEEKTYQFIYNGSNWNIIDGEDVRFEDISLYGVTLDNDVIPRNGDKINIKYEKAKENVFGVFKRSEYMNESIELDITALHPILTGSKYGGKMFILQDTEKIFTLDVSKLYFTPFNVNNQVDKTISINNYTCELRGDNENPATSFTINHGLDTMNVYSAIYDNEGNEVKFNITIIDKDTIRVSSDIELYTEDVFTLIVFAGKGNMLIYTTEYRGDSCEDKRSKLLVHGLNTNKIVCHIYDETNTELFINKQLIDKNKILISSDYDLDETDYFKVIVLGVD